MIRGVIIILFVVLIAWMNPEADKAGEGNRLYSKELYDEATAKYTEVLIDLPGSPRLHFNIGNAAYKKESYEEAVESFIRAASLASDPELEGKVYYNLGNCKYRQGRLKENTNIRRAISLYRKALDYYKLALDRFPKDPDVQYNHEFVERRIKELLDIQQQQQGDQQGQQQGQQGQRQGQRRGRQQGQQQGQQRGQGQQQQEGQQGDQQEGQEGDQQEGQQGEQGEQGQEDQEGTNGQSENEEENTGQAGVQGEEENEKQGSGQKGNLTSREAKMLLDSLRDEELRRPDNTQTRRQLGRVLKNW